MSAESRGVFCAIEQEADAYFKRNGARPDAKETDPVWNEIELLHESRSIGSLLEVGAFDGRRVAYIRERLGCSVVGVEASPKAVAQGAIRFPDIPLIQGVAPMSIEPWLSQRKFDAIVLGFFLYLLPRELLFRMASVVNDLLTDGGHIILHDFLSPAARKRPYEHSPSLVTYKMDYSQAWTWNPQYSLMSRTLKAHGSNVSFPADQDTWATVDVVRKMAPHDSYA